MTEEQIELLKERIRVLKRDRHVKVNYYEEWPNTGLGHGINYISVGPGTTWEKIEKKVKLIEDYDGVTLEDLGDLVDYPKISGKSEQR